MSFAFYYNSPMPPHSSPVSSYKPDPGHSVTTSQYYETEHVWRVGGGKTVDWQRFRAFLHTLECCSTGKLLCFSKWG